MKRFLIILFIVFVISEVIWEILWAYYPEMKLLRHCFNLVGGASIWVLLIYVCSIRKA